MRYDVARMMCSLTKFAIIGSQAYEGVSHISRDCPTLLSQGIPGSGIESKYSENKGESTGGIIRERELFRFKTERSLVQFQSPQSMKSISYGFRVEAFFFIATLLT